MENDPFVEHVTNQIQAEATAREYSIGYGGDEVFALSTAISVDGKVHPDKLKVSGFETKIPDAPFVGIVQVKWAATGTSQGRGVSGQGDLDEFIVRGRAPPSHPSLSFWFSTRLWRWSGSGMPSCFPLVLASFALRESDMRGHKGVRGLNNDGEKGEKSINTLKEQDHKEECSTLYHGLHP